MAETMRAMAVTGDGVGMTEIPKPTPGSGEVRVKVIASAVNPAEEKVIGGDFVGRFLHAKTSPLVLGWDFAGTVDALGDGVADIDEGAAVWGHLEYSPTQKQGTFAEYVALPRGAFAAKPDDVPYHVAAAAATVAMTSLQSLRDLGRLGQGGNQVASKRADLELVGGWLSHGLEVPIDSRHKIADLGAALRRQADRARVGRVVVDVAEEWPPS